MSTIFTGDHVAATVRLKRSGAAYAVDAGSTVKAAIISETALVSGVVTCSSVASGADWPNGVVVAIFADTDTADMPEIAAAIEIQIAEAGGNITTFQTPNRIQVKKGLIP